MSDVAYDGWMDENPYQSTLTSFEPQNDGGTKRASAVCPRCQGRFSVSELTNVPKWLRVFYLAFGIILPPRSAMERLKQEVTVQYCRVCCRSVGMALFFVGFVVSVTTMGFLVGLYFR